MCLLEILHFTCACNIQHLNRCDTETQIDDLSPSLHICPLYSVMTITASPSVYPCPRGHSVHDVLLPSMVGYNLNYCIDGAERGRVGEFEPPTYTDEEGFRRPRKPGGWDDKWWEGAMVGKVSSQRRGEELKRLKGEFWTKESKHVHPGAKGLWGALKRGHDVGLEAMRGDEEWERVPKPIKKVAGLAERSRSRRGKEREEGRRVPEAVYGEMSGARFDGRLRRGHGRRVALFRRW
jgi:hypothetical protein